MLSSNNGAKLSLRLQYWHQTEDGESPDHNASLRRFAQEWLGLPEHVSFQKKWEPRLVDVQVGSGLPRNIVPVQVSNH